MTRYFCHDRPDVLSLETRVVDGHPGAVVLKIDNKGRHNRRVRIGLSED